MSAFTSLASTKRMPLQHAIRRWLPRPETVLQLPDLSPREVAYQVTDK